MATERRKCEHERSQLTWDYEPNVEMSPGDTLLWFGKCVCGQRVVEEYNSIGIFTADTDGKGDLEHDRVFIRE